MGGLYDRPLKTVRRTCRGRMDVIAMAGRVATAAVRLRKARTMVPVGMECATEESDERIVAQQQEDRSLAR